MIRTVFRWLLHRDLEGEWGWLRLLWVAVAVFGAFLSILPLYWMVRTSLLEASDFYSVPLIIIPQHLYFGNYLKVFELTDFSRYYINTIVIAVLTTLNSLFVNTTAGYAFARLKFPGRDKVFYAYLATMMVPHEVTIVPLFLVVRFLGFYDTYLGITLPGAASAFTIFLLRQFFLSIPREIEEAALMDGCSPWSVLWHITLPLSRPVFAVIVIGSVQGAFESFVWPLIVTRTDSIRPVAVTIAMLSGGWGGQYPGVLQAALVMMVLPVIALALYAQRYILKGFARALIIG